MCSNSRLLVREAGLEPARAYCTLEPESSESANSTTRAYPRLMGLAYHSTSGPACQPDFRIILPKNSSFTGNAVKGPKIFRGRFCSGPKLPIESIGGTAYERDEGFRCAHDRSGPAQR